MNIPHTASTSGSSTVQRAGHGARPAATGQGAPTGLLGFASFLSDATDAADDTPLLGDTDGLPGKRRNSLKAADDPGTALSTPDPLAAAAQQALPLSARPTTAAQAPRTDAGNTLATASLGSGTAPGLDASTLAQPPALASTVAAPTTAATPRQGITAQTTTTAPAPLAASVSTPGASVRELLQRLEPAAADPLAQATPTAPASGGTTPPDALRAATVGTSAPASTTNLSTPVTVSLSSPAGVAPPPRSTVDMDPTQGGASAPTAWTEATPEAAALSPSTVSTTPGAASIAAQRPVATAVSAAVPTEVSAAPSSPAPETAATPVRRPEEAQAALRAQATATPAPAAPTTASAAAPTEPDARATAPLATRPAAGAARAERLSAAAESRRGPSDPSGSATTASALPAAERVQDPSATQTLAAHTSTTEHRNGAEPGPSGLWLDGTMPPSTAAADVSASADTAQAAPLSDFADKLAYISANGLSSADFSLGGLGDDAVNVRISMSGNEATVEFRSDGSETRQVLEQAMGQLETLFKKEGLVLSGVSVGGQDSPQQPVFSGAQSQAQAQAQSQSQSQSPSQARTGTTRRFGPGEGAEAIARTPSRQGTGRLDVFA